MDMNETWITIVGNVVDEPKLRETKTGTKVLSFRVASTSRRFDNEQERWIDNETLYASVTCWRWFAENVAASLHKGQPVVVTGKIFTREYRKEETVRVSYEVDAVAVGHDLARGRTQFTKSLRPRVMTTVETDADGIPPNLTAERLDLLPDELSQLRKPVSVG
jgi:single-strand DNA-binding protein